GGISSDSEAVAVLDHLLRTGLVVVQQVAVARPGKGADARGGLLLTPAGKLAIQQPPQAVPTGAAPQSPQPPADLMQGDAGRVPLGGARNAPGGVGEMRGADATSVTEGPPSDHGISLQVAHSRPTTSPACVTNRRPVPISSERVGQLPGETD